MVDFSCQLTYLSLSYLPVTASFKVFLSLSRTASSNYGTTCAYPWTTSTTLDGDYVDIYLPPTCGSERRRGGPKTFLSSLHIFGIVGFQIPTEPRCPLSSTSTLPKSTPTVNTPQYCSSSHTIQPLPHRPCGTGGPVQDRWFRNDITVFSSTTSACWVPNTVATIALIFSTISSPWPSTSTSSALSLCWPLAWGRWPEKVAVVFSPGRASGWICWSPSV